jgi:hypothetical protein
VFPGLLREEADPAAARAFFLRCVALTFRSSWRSAGDVFMFERALRKASPTNKRSKQINAGLRVKSKCNYAIPRATVYMVI